MKKNIIYTENTPLTIRQQLKSWLIPKKWQHILRTEHKILINDIYQPFNYVLKNYDIITIDFDFPPRTANQNYLSSGNIPNVLFEDEDLLIINKPAGQKSHPNSPLENNTAMNDAKTYLNFQNLKPLMIHRLDKETSGLMMIAKNPYIVPIMNQQLSKKTFKRDYYAVVDLHSEIPNSGLITYPIGPDPLDKRKIKVRNDGLDSKTSFKLINKNFSNAILSIKLFTGRTHQIRVHLAENNWPITNDPLYNPKKSNGKMKLFAYKISYMIPFTNKKKSVEIDFPTDFKL